MKRTLPALLAAVFLLTACQSPTSAQGGLSGGLKSSTTPSATEAPADSTFKVVSVTDGDTIRVKPASQAADTPSEPVRIIGLNTPEIRGENAPQCWGKEASDEAHRLLPKGIAVVLTPDPTQADVDRFQRKLRYVDVQGLPTGTDWSAYMVGAGFAVKFEYEGKPGQRANSIRTAEDSAKAAHKGLWGPPCNGNVDLKTATPAPSTR
jgi:micrococcal nuclease